MYTDVHTYIFQHLRIQYNSRSLNYFFTSFVCVSPEIDNIFPKDLLSSSLVMSPGCGLQLLR